MKSLFPEEMMNPSPSEMTMERVASKLTYFTLQLHLLHWQTTSIAEHGALGSLYDYVHDFTDGAVEKIMGYMGGRRINVFKLEPLTTITATAVVDDLISFASNLKAYGEANNYHDICNLADSLSGEAVKCKYLLTMS